MFGRRSAGTVFGLVALSHQLGSALGSYAGGLVHDLTGSYTAFFLGGRGPVGRRGLHVVGDLGGARAAAGAGARLTVRP